MLLMQDLLVYILEELLQVIVRLVQPKEKANIYGSIHPDSCQLTINYHPDEELCFSVKIPLLNLLQFSGQELRKYSSQIHLLNMKLLISRELYNQLRLDRWSKKRIF